MFDEDKNRGKCLNCGKTIFLTPLGYVHLWKEFGPMEHRRRIKCENKIGKAEPITKKTIINKILSEI